VIQSVAPIVDDSERTSDPASSLLLVRILPSPSPIKNQHFGVTR
jgi:hypothetical protein